VIESYSSQGGAPILFDSTGVRLATPIVRQKPDFTGPDGGNDTFLGFTLASAGISGSNGELSTTIAACQNNPSYPNFFGTSAATPHVASIAALMLQANSTLTPSQIYAALRSSALPMGTTPNYTSGYGFVQADAAFALVPPGAPTISTSASSVVVGSSATITWSSINATSCSASGSWSGSLATSGSKTVTPSAVGTAAFTLTCANVSGSSAASSVRVTAAPAAAAAPQSVTTAAAPQSSSGGGGSFGLGMLLGLGAISLVRVRRTRLHNAHRFSSRRSSMSALGFHDHK
jgi:subtilisin family serine protease